MNRFVEGLKNFFSPEAPKKEYPNKEVENYIKEITEWRDVRRSIPQTATIGQRENYEKLGLNMLDDIRGISSVMRLSKAHTMEYIERHIDLSDEEKRAIAEKMEKVAWEFEQNQTHDKVAEMGKKIDERNQYTRDNPNLLYGAMGTEGKGPSKIEKEAARAAAVDTIRDVIQNMSENGNQGADKTK